MSITPYALDVSPWNTKMRLAITSPFISLDGVVVTPDVVTLTVIPPGAAPIIYTWTNGATPPDPTLTISLVTTGTFKGDVDNSIGQPGVWEWWYNGAPGPSGLDTTKTKEESPHQFILVVE